MHILDFCYRIHFLFSRSKFDRIQNFEHNMGRNIFVSLDLWGPQSIQGEVGPQGIQGEVGTMSYQQLVKDGPSMSRKMDQ